MRSLVLMLTVALAFLTACEKQPPARLEISPSGKINMVKKGAKETLQVMAYDKKNRPWIEELKTTWESSDDSVITVSAAGEVAAVGSGDAKVVARAEGLEASVDAHVIIVGSVEIAEDTPKKLKMLKQDIVLKVTVKDDKGNLIEKPQLTFTASDYCVDVDPSGKVHPQSVGRCSVRVSSRGVEDVHAFEVY
jgi:hypothetical protein